MNVFIIHCGRQGLTNNHETLDKFYTDVCSGYIFLLKVQDRLHTLSNYHKILRFKQLNYKVFIKKKSFLCASSLFLLYLNFCTLFCKMKQLLTNLQQDRKFQLSGLLLVIELSCICYTQSSKNVLQNYQRYMHREEVLGH